MDQKVYYTPTFKKKNIKTYVITICQDFNKMNNFLQSNMKITKLPKTIMENKNNDFKRTFYLNNYEILFLNNAKKCTNESLYQLFGELGVMMQTQNNGNILIYLNSNDKNIIKNQVISYILGLYRIQDYKSNINTQAFSTFFYHKSKLFKETIQNAITEATIQNEIRTLTNAPANILNSLYFKKYIVKQLNTEKNNHLKIKTFNEKDLNKLGLNLILAVNKGSNNPAFLVQIEYKNLPKTHKKNKQEIKPIVFIGKGVMFDSGGYSIKRGDFSDMKNDMNGSAIVYGLMKLINQMNIEGHYIGLCPLVENMVDSKATRPGDIVTCYNKKTVEITDTDAEGRLIMADCLAYSKKYNPSLIIDVATLTGDASYMFAGKSSIIMGNNNETIQKIINCGKENNEKIWEMPLWNEYVELTKSNIADYKNFSYNSQAGAIMAGAFLSNFVPEKTKWIHLDIAGVDNLPSDTSMRSFGSSGEILRTLFCYINQNK